MKTVYLREFITCFKVVHSVISDNFYFDQITVRSDLKKLCKIYKIIKFVSLDNFGSFRRENSARYEVYHINISCWKNNFGHLSSQLKHSIIKSEISVSDFSKFWILQIWKILANPGGILEGWSWKSMLFKITFLKSFISIIKLYDQIWQNYFF